MSILKHQPKGKMYKLKKGIVKITFLVYHIVVKKKEENYPYFSIGYAIQGLG